MKGFGKELALRMRGVLTDAYSVQPVVPLEIKLHLERLRLAELLQSAPEIRAPWVPAHEEFALAAG